MKFFLRLPLLATFVLLVGSSQSAAQSTTNKSFSLFMGATSPVFESSDDWQDNIIQGTISNPSDTVLKLYYSRVQTLPPEWSTSVCFGLSCFADFLDSATSEFDPHDSRDLLLHLTFPGKAEGSAKVYLRIGVVGGRPDDTMQVIYEPSAKYLSAVRVGKAVNSGIFPQPAVNGKMLQISGLSSSAQVQVFDLLGKEIILERRLGAGQLALPQNLVSGTYFLQIRDGKSVRSLPFLVE